MHALVDEFCYTVLPNAFGVECSDVAGSRGGPTVELGLDRLLDGFDVLLLARCEQGGDGEFFALELLEGGEVRPAERRWVLALGDGGESLGEVVGDLVGVGVVVAVGAPCSRTMR